MQQDQSVSEMAFRSLRPKPPRSELRSVAGVHPLGSSPILLLGRSDPSYGHYSPNCLEGKANSQMLNFRFTVLGSSHVTGPFAYSVRLRRSASVVA